MDIAEPIAIIGMAGRFPGARDIDEFRDNLFAGLPGFTVLSDEELVERGVAAEEFGRADYVRRRPLLDGADTFDAQLFDMTPRDAEVRDPQYRLFLETTHAALGHAGYDPFTYPGAVGVYAGTQVNRYRPDFLEKRPDVFAAVGLLAIAIANAPDYLSTFVSYKLGLRGPSLTMLTACSTSLVAVHTAAAALRSGDCDIALAGGVSLEFPFHEGYQYVPGGIDAADGYPRAFDEHATGTNFGNGVGVVVLKPLAKALADRDTVYAVVRGSAINNDGARKVGFTAPSVDGQSECVQRALRSAGVDPRTISYVEAHGTGTPVGDPIELAGLIDAFRAVGGPDLPTRYCGIGSVKSNIGHLSHAAGVAGLIKTVLALHHERIPPSINVSAPSSAVDWANSPFTVVTEPTAWPAVPGEPRRAAVSSFGIGGTNAHVILEEAPRSRPADRPTGRPEAVLWSAADTVPADQLRDRLCEFFAGLPADEFGDAAHTLRIGRTARQVRGAVVATTAEDAARALRDPARVLRPDTESRRLAFAFPGQGAQHPRMLWDLYTDEPLFRRGCDAAFDVLEPILGHDLRSTWADAADINETAVAQPLLYVVEYTLAHCLIGWGARPELVFGHSLGELVAAAVAGVFDFESGLRAVAARAQLMQDMPRGQMLAVRAGPDDVAEYLDGVCVAAVNGPRSVVLAGPDEAIADADAALTARGLKTKPLRTSHAFHSPLMAKAAVEFEHHLAGTNLRPPTIPVVSAATGRLLRPEQAVSAEFWARQLIQPVLFDAAVTAVAAQPTTVVEVGPGRTLHTLVRGRTRALSAESADLDTSVQDVLAQLWVDGKPVDYWHGLTDRGYRRVAAPGYPYQRKRYWIDRPKRAATPEPTPEPQPQPQSWSAGHMKWVAHHAGRAPGAQLGTRRGNALLLTSGTSRIRASFGQAGYRVTAVRHGENGFDATDAAQWSALLDRAEDAGEAPDVIAHAALCATPPGVGLGDLDEQLATAVHSLFACLRALSGRRRPVTLLLAGRHQVDVTGDEPVNPVAAMGHALLRSAARELAGVSTVCLDVSDNTPEDVLARELADLTAPLVALRGSTRWLPLLSPLDVTDDQFQSRLRYRGAYLVTGGLGGIGLAIAKAMAGTGLRPRLGLLGRSGLAPDDPRHADIAELVDADAEVELIAGDVTDLESLRSAVAVMESRFGPVHGVIHSAGLAGGGLAQRRTPADVAAVLAPKTRGVLNLESVFADRPALDLMVLFSSSAAVAGLFGSSDYAAANAFMDAHARSVSGRERLTLSVQWPAWNEVGMAARSRTALAMFTPAEQDEGWSRVYRPGHDWELDEHVVGGVPVLPGTAMLELPLLAVRAEGVHPPDTVLELRDTVFLAPITAEGPVEVRVLLTPAAGTHRFRVQSRLSSGQWTENAAGVVAVGTSPVAVDLSEVGDRVRRVEHDVLAEWIDFGPRWTVLAELRGGPGEVLARLVLPEPFHGDLATHPMHPAVMDVASQLLGDVAEGVQRAPFRYRRVMWCAPLTSDVTVYSRFSDTDRQPRPTDFDVHDTASGALLVRVEGFAIRDVRTGTLGTAPSPATAPSGLLSPADGADAFLALLAGDIPPVVLVNPPGSPLTVDGIPWEGRRTAAPTPVEPVRTSSAQPVADEDSVAAALRELWIGVLGVDDVGTSDDFFELGGDSMAAVQLVEQVRKLYGVDLSAGAMFELPTIGQMASEVRALSGGETS
jgi:phthiocerol/phenolphthiocerol synthesis type-I polyketide synthase E